MEKYTAVYVRVSSRSQDLRSQEGDLRKWAECQDGAVQWYSDKRTGTTMSRPGWNKLQADLEAGLVSRVVVWRLDRLGRTASGLCKLFDDLRARGVGLVSLKDSLDLETPAGRLMACVLASVAAYEHEVRRERQQAGIEAAIASGKRWGGSKAGRRITVTEAQADLVVRLHRERVPITKIAESVGLSRPTIYRLLESIGGQARTPEVAG